MKGSSSFETQKTLHPEGAEGPSRRAKGFLLLRMKSGFLALLCIFTCLAPAHAVEPDEVLDDPVLEERAREIGRELRCITCQSQSIDDSNAPLAKDLRIIVRERLVAGDSDEEVIAYVAERYGDYVRLKPAMRADTALLWLAPALALVGAVAGAFFYFRHLKRLEKTTPALNDDDEDLPEI